MNHYHPYIEIVDGECHHVARYEPIRLGKGMTFLFKLLTKFGVINTFWDRQLKENNAYKNSFDRPYLSELVPHIHSSLGNNNHT